MRTGFGWALAECIIKLVNEVDPDLDWARINTFMVLSVFWS